MLPSPAGRLDGWKAIAEYLGRTERTAQRWAGVRGLPVRHLPGGKTSTVFAFQSEIDEWLRQGQARAANGNAAVDLAPPATATVAPRYALARARSMVGVGVTLATVLLVATTWSRLAAVPAEIQRVELRARSLAAYDAQDRLLWRTPLPVLSTDKAGGVAPVSHRLQHTQLVELTGDSSCDALVFVYGFQRGQRVGLEPHATSAAAPHPLSLVHHAVHAVSSAGERLWTWEPAATFAFAGRRFGAPWRWSASLSVPSGGATRTHVALIHEPWWPSYVVQLDESGRAALRYVQAGHIYTLANADVAGTPFILAAGVNNEYAAASLAVLDPDAKAATSPQTAGSPYDCEDCPGGRPARVVLFPRTEINRLSGNPYNRAHEILVTPERVDVSVFEDDQSRAIYTLARDFTPVRVTMSDRYWETHRRLERDGRLTHSAELCPERHSVESRIWTPAEGWTTVRVRNSLANLSTAALTPRPNPIP